MLCHVMLWRINVVMLHYHDYGDPTICHVIENQLYIMLWRINSVMLWRINFCHAILWRINPMSCYGETLSCYTIIIDSMSSYTMENQLYVILWGIKIRFCHVYYGKSTLSHIMLWRINSMILIKLTSLALLLLKLCT